MLCLPRVLFGAVIINEVAWMGDVDSANNEWIELYNDGASVSVDGWELSDGMNLSIPLSGTIGANAYAVLERTDDTSALGVAFLIYTGALVNTGATLTLKRSDGSIEDQIAGGEDWQNIGGDNTTKETAQYTSLGWVTGTPSPGHQNETKEKTITVGDEEQDSDNNGTKSESQTTKKSSGTNSKSVKMVLPDTELSLTLFAPQRAYVHQPVIMKMVPSGIGEKLLPSVRFTWNYGDLGTGKGKEVTHVYEYPGTYVVYATGEFLRHHASVRHEITVLPVAFSLTTNRGGDLQIHNDAKYEIDLGGYSVRGEKTVVIPEHTVLIPNGTITIPRNRLGASYAWLMDQEHTIVASTFNNDTSILSHDYSQQEEIATALPIGSYVSLPVYDSVPESNESFTFSTDGTFEEFTPEKTAPNTTSTVPVQDVEREDSQPATVNEAKVPIPDNALPYLGLVGVLSLGMVALYVGRVGK